MRSVADTLIPSSLARIYFDSEANQYCSFAKLTFDPYLLGKHEVALPFKETDLFVFNLFGTGLKLTVFKKCPHTSSLFVYFVEVVCSLRPISNTISHSQFEKKLLLMFSFL